MGTFAVICLMTGHVVTAHTTPHVLPDPGGNSTEPVGPLPTHIEVSGTAWRPLASVGVDLTAS